MLKVCSASGKLILGIVHWKPKCFYNSFLWRVAHDNGDVDIVVQLSISICSCFKIIPAEQANNGQVLFAMTGLYIFGYNPRFTNPPWADIDFKGL